MRWTLQTLDRWWHTLRYHRAEQVLRRLARIARERIVPPPDPAWYERRAAQAASAVRPLDAEPTLSRKLNDRLLRGGLERARALLEGQFAFVGLPRRLPTPVDWGLRSWPEVPHLWRFHLHYGEYLLDLLAAHRYRGDSPYLERACLLMDDWVVGNPIGAPGWRLAAWHPYCISRRVVPWLLVLNTAAPKPGLRRRLLQSLVCQLLFLEVHLENDLGGNHLLENAKALLLGAVAFGGASATRWHQKGLRIFDSELSRQILPHGEHFERSPMYHAVVLENCLDLAELARQRFPDVAHRFAGLARKLARFLEVIVHPDGEIPLFGDSVFGETPCPRLLLEASAGLPSLLAGQRKSAGSRQAGSSCERCNIMSAETVAGRSVGFEAVLDVGSDGGKTPSLPRFVRLGPYWSFRDRDSFLILDAGPVGADDMPAHAHSDLLAIEVSLGGERVFVDSGCFEYADRPMRRYCRSAWAHNCMVIDGRSPCDPWSSFRMGYRGRPAALKCGTDPAGAWAHAEHDAYRRLGVPRVQRLVRCAASAAPWYCIDTALGRGCHTLEVFLHLHPAVKLGQLAHDLFEMDVSGRRYWLQLTGPPAIAEVIRGWYCPEFGRRYKAPVLRWATRGCLPRSLGWVLHFTDPRLGVSDRHRRAGTPDGRETAPEPLLKRRRGRWPHFRYSLGNS